MVLVEILQSLGADDRAGGGHRGDPSLASLAVDDERMATRGLRAAQVDQVLDEPAPIPPSV
jgi:hypothetical protein